MATEREGIPLTLFGVVSACFFLTFFILNPGMMSPDSIVTWGMSETLVFTDQHPPIYALMLRGLRHLWNQPGVVVLFNVGVFSVGSLLLAEVIRRRWTWAGYLFPLVIFLPFVLNYIGVLWKDTALGVCWWTASAIAVYVYDTKGCSRHFLMALAYICFTFGLLVRHNSITAAPFLLFGLLAVHFKAAPEILSRKSMALFAAAVAVSALLFYGGNWIINRTFEVKHIQVFEAIPIFDLAGITRNTGKNVFPYAFTQEELERLSSDECYHINDWNTYEFQCHFVADAVRKMGPTLIKAWLAAIVDHPLAYLQHRSTVYAHFLRLGYDEPYFLILYPGILPNEFKFKHPHHRLYQLFQGYILGVQNWPFFKPWFWLLLATLGATGSLVWGRGTMMGLLGASVALSAVVYLGTYAVFGISSDFRYAYWAILATLQSAVLLVLAVHEKRGAQAVAQGGGPNRAFAARRGAYLSGKA